MRLSQWIELLIDRHPFTFVGINGSATLPVETVTVKLIVTAQSPAPSSFDGSYAGTLNGTTTFLPPAPGILGSQTASDRFCRL